MELLKEHEGFVGYPYVDPVRLDKNKELANLLHNNTANLTIGYGTLLPLDQEEAEMLLLHRLGKSYKEMLDKKPFVKGLHKNAQVALLNMWYNLGQSRALKFKRMWKALEKKDYDTASEEMIDSKWYKQLPNRVSKLSKLLKG
jgi:lysozyme